MGQKIREIYDKYRWLVLYFGFGIIPIMVDYATYAACTRCFYFSTALSNGLAWFFTSVSAYICNRLFVFEHVKSGFIGICKEFGSFISCRVMTGLLEVFLMVLFVDGFHFYDIYVKIGTTLLAILINLLISKNFIFTPDEISEVELADKYVN